MADQVAKEVLDEAPPSSPESKHDRWYDAGKDLAGITAAQSAAEKFRPGPRHDLPVSFLGAPGTARLRAPHEPPPASVKLSPEPSSEDSVYGSRFQRGMR